MERIASFTVNHDVLKKGMYISRIDGDIVTYDIRMKVPNGGDYLSASAAHTIEHLFATFARNSRLDEYFKTGTQIDGQVSEAAVEHLKLIDGVLRIRVIR